MLKQTIEVSAPANIALIKYMGKTCKNFNKPSNPSLSYTLPHLQTTVRITETFGERDCWEPFVSSSCSKSNINKGHSSESFSLSDMEKEKFLHHFLFLKKQLNISGNYIISSYNNFAKSCGLASSASSFAALTKASYLLALQKKYSHQISVKDLSALSRRGSGSSCRSFFAPWAYWEGEAAEEFTTHSVYKDLDHMALIVDRSKKKISSRQAHERVTTSPHYKGRSERASQRLVQLTDLFGKEGRECWRSIFDIVLEEFMDMHRLFETSQLPFSYFSKQTTFCLDILKDFWIKYQDGPLITMDAGPNIHLLWRKDQKPLQKKVVYEFLEKKIEIFQRK